MIKQIIVIKVHWYTSRSCWRMTRIHPIFLIVLIAHRLGGPQKIIHPFALLLTYKFIMNYDFPSFSLKVGK